MKIRRIATAEAPLGAATQMGELSGTSRVTAGIDLSDIRGLDRVPELPLRPEHALGEKTREHRHANPARAVQLGWTRRR